MVHKKIKIFYGFDDIFKRVFHSDGLKEAKRDIENNVSELWEFQERGFYIVRGEYQGFEKTDFVLVAGVGCDAKRIEKYFSEYARKKGFKRIRIHSTRKGAWRFIKSLGYQIEENRGNEIVFSKNLRGSKWA